MDFVLITGCDSGFGKLVVDSILKNFPKTGIIACYHSEKGMRNGPSVSNRFFKHILEITSDDSVLVLHKNVSQFLSYSERRLVGVLNNAGGLLSSGPCEFTDISVDEAQMNLNFLGTVRVTKAFLPLIRNSKGRIVNVSSILGLIGAPLGGVYSASKFALEGWTDALRREMLSFGVHVCLIEPGMFGGTDFYKNYTTPVEVGWSKLNSEVKATYGEDYKQYTMERLVKVYSALGSSDPHPVVNAMLNALLAPKPKRRYRLGTDCKFLARILQWIPTCISDLALTVVDVLVTGDRSLYPRMPAKGLSQSWTSIVWFSLFGYASCVWWILVGLVMYVVAYPFI
jgi:NAD(P)-dependent dehydrogenase (short-subunit alcohol dehydrogenase family)